MDFGRRNRTRWPNHTLLSAWAFGFKKGMAIMKKAILAIISLTMCAASAMAEMQFPEFEKQPDQAQASWGYKITRTTGRNPSFSVTIPPKAALKCTGARLYIRNKENRLLAQFDVAPITQKDGSLVFTMALFEDLDGRAELIVYTDQLPEAVMFSNFGGFTFKAEVEKP